MNACILSIVQPRTPETFIKFIKCCVDRFSRTIIPKYLRHSIISRFGRLHFINSFNVSVLVTIYKKNGPGWTKYIDRLDLCGMNIC